MSQNLYPPPPMANQYANPAPMPIQAGYPPPIPMQAVNQPLNQYPPYNYNQIGGYPAYPTPVNPPYIQQPYPPIIHAPHTVVQPPQMIILGGYHSGCNHKYETYTSVKASAWVWAIILCCICPIISWIPFCMDECYEHHTICTHCQANH